MTNEEQLLQEARLEAEKIYPEQQYRGTYPYRQEGYIQGYIANAKKKDSEAVEFVQWIITNDNKIDVTLTVQQVYDLYLQQQKQ